MNSAYTATVRQLLDIAPVVFTTPHFAIKGGTALNLFLHSLPRLSVDIDVVFTNYSLGREEALQAIASELSAISQRLKAMGYEVRQRRNSASNETRLMVAGPLAEEHNKQALAAKADATCWVIEHLRAQAAYRQQQAKRLTDLSRFDAGRADALEDSLVLVLTRLQPTATRFSFPNHELSSRKSQAVEIDDEDALDPEWLSFTTTSKPDKAAIKEALKAGQLIPGAQLISRRSWRIH